MGVTRILWKVLVWGVFFYAMTALSIVGYSVLKPLRAAETFKPADVIVVLGGGVFADGSLDEATQLRVARAVQLFEAGVAPRLHMTGGSARPDSPSGGAGMKALALSIGVPEAAVSTEGLSQSTLQNALFSKPNLNGAQSLVIVTEAFHLPRAWASFRWAGFDQDLQLAASTRFRWTDPNPWQSSLTMVFREAAAWWFNLGRALAFGLAGLLGLPEEDRVPWLA